MKGGRSINEEAFQIGLSRRVNRLCEFWTRLAKWLSEVLFHNQQIHHKLKHEILKTVTEGSGTVSRRDNLGIRMIAIMYVLPGRA